MNLVTKYLVSQKKSKTYKNLILSSIKHACEMNDVILNWKKLKRFINSAKSGNEINGRKRHGEKITHDSYLIVKKFNLNLNEGIKGRQFSKDSLQALLDDNIRNCGIREINHFNQFKRKEVPRLHGFRKFFTKQPVDSKVNPEIREMLLGNNIGLASAYYRPTEQEMYDEYQKALDNLIIDHAYLVRSIIPDDIIHEHFKMTCERIKKLEASQLNE